MGYNVQCVLKKVLLYYIRRHKKFQNHFLVMIWNCYHLKKWNIEFTRNCHIFKNSYLFKNINWKTCHLPRKLYEHIITIWGIFTIMVPLFHHKTPGFCFCYLPNTKSKWNKFKWEIFDNSNYDSFHGDGGFSHVYVIMHKYFVRKLEMQKMNT
jgi:hypothetical protein